MPVTVLFVPWSIHQSTVGMSTVPGFEYADKNNLWLRHQKEKGKESYQVWYTGKVSPMLSAMGTGQIYIRGHSLDSLGEIFSNSQKKNHDGFRTGVPQRDSLTPTQVADRLIETGLPKTFAGKLKCYNCYSSLGGEAGFAQQFADLMWERGFTHCLFFGYRGAATSSPMPHGEADLAIHSNLKSGVYKDVKLENGRLVRASSPEGRDQIIPKGASKT